MKRHTTHLFRRNLRGDRGAAMILTTVFFLMITTAIATTMSIVFVSDLKLYRQLLSTKRALIAADAAIEEAMVRIANGTPVSPTEVVRYNGATGTVNILDLGAEEKGLYATGESDGFFRKSYAHAIKATNGNFPYGAQVGRGGARMGNNAFVNSAGLYNSNIYSGGAILGGGGVSVAGNVTISSSISDDLIAQSTSCTADETVGRTNPNIDFAQSFSISTSSPEQLYKVSLYVRRNSNPTGATLRITEDDSGKPSTATLASQALDYTTVGTTYGWTDVIFSSPPTLDPAQTYWIVLDATQNNSKYWTWCRSNSDTYLGGVSQYKQDWSTAGSWTAVGGDMAFKLSIGGGVSVADQVVVSGTMKADVISDSMIGGDAYYKSISGSVVAGTPYTGASAPTPPEIRLPLSSTTISLWKAQAQTGGVITGDCGTGGVAGCNAPSFSIGPKKVDGNLVLDINQTLTLTGTLWVTGNVDVMNNSEIRCHPSFGSKSCTLIADGYINVENNGTFTGSGSAGSFVLVLSTKEGCMGTSGVGCAPGNYAITISNNVDGALFYSADSFVGIVNNAIVTAVVGYGLDISPNAGINYDNAVMSMVMSSGATTTISGWDVIQWSEFY